MTCTVAMHKQPSAELLGLPQAYTCAFTATSPEVRLSTSQEYDVDHPNHTGPQETFRGTAVTLERLWSRSPLDI